MPITLSVSVNNKMIFSRCYYNAVVTVAEKPSIDLSKLKNITVRAGQEIKVPVPIKGWPVPTAVWEQNGKPLDKGGRVKIEVS